MGAAAMLLIAAAASAAPGSANAKRHMTATPTTTAAPAPTSTSTAGPSPTAVTHHIKTVFIILMENHNWTGDTASTNIKGNPSAPYINNTLLPMASHAENYFNPPGNHPSLPNYLWLEGGQCYSFCGTDNNPSLSPNGIPAASPPNALHDQLTNAGITWRDYAEGITDGSCPTSDISTTNYAVRHNPFVYFNDVNGNATTCSTHEKSFSDLSVDLNNGSVAQYNFITPNLCDDMHDSCAPTKNSIQQGDTWLSQNVPMILNSAAYKNGGALFITWDEAAKGDGPIGMIVLSPFAKGNSYSNTIAYTHSSTLRTVEDIFGVSPLLGDAKNATDLSDLFTSFP
jgi:phosphatidylinositol-3-phosphatase